MILRVLDWLLQRATSFDLTTQKYGILSILGKGKSKLGSLEECISFSNIGLVCR